MGRRRRSRRRGKCFSNGNVKIDNFLKKKIQVEAERKVHEERDARQCCFADKT
jgi:hypothetical protein